MLKTRRQCLTLGWFETRQCSQTFTRCSKQNCVVTFFLGHLHNPMVVILLCTRLKYFACTKNFNFFHRIHINSFATSPFLLLNFVSRLQHLSTPFHATARSSYGGEEGGVGHEDSLWTIVSALPPLQLWSLTQK